MCQTRDLWQGAASGDNDGDSSFVYRFLRRSLSHGFWRCAQKFSLSKRLAGLEMAEVCMVGVAQFVTLSIRFGSLSLSGTELEFADNARIREWRNIRFKGSVVASCHTELAFHGYMRYHSRPFQRAGSLAARCGRTWHDVIRQMYPFITAEDLLDERPLCGMGLASHPCGGTAWRLGLHHVERTRDLPTRRNILAVSRTK